ncbi:MULTISPECIES: nucleotidyltransferase domain-containing protein [unclassified Streptomyces]|uniref:nucleotidyltransferase domain-containing protein n=1 Tax=unclassified Streptomyces TaxID=2593676 RepID=UPI000DB92924|nr:MULTISPECIES: nucleotidyltransferase domain-containing protein [unclassified Streptomyces]MYT70413.1 nucleotidyltransferase domain-containing protein [Streptomyces sp. SID8367]RAJ90111.1 nucleotidyltransferase-like protein [Streptomyces sp. PsTaAH-137]
MPVPTDDKAAADPAFLDRLADILAALPGVHAVALGGSRAQGTHTPDSDWDTAVYYRGSEGLFAPRHLRAAGWEGEATEIGGWGGGVFNGGGWFDVEGRRVDVHYRDLDDIERILADAEEGRFRVESLMFHLAGIPSYLVVAELAVNRVLRGTAPRPDGYPDALRRTAPEEWWGRARITLHYARVGNAPKGGRTEVVGAVAVAAMSAAHAVLAARGEWVTNEKRLLERAGLRAVDAIVTDPGLGLVELVDRAEELLAAAVAEALQTVPEAPKG